MPCGPVLFCVSHTIVPHTSLAQSFLLYRLRLNVRGDSSDLTKLGLIRRICCSFSISLLKPDLFRGLSLMLWRSDNSTSSCLLAGAAFDLALKPHDQQSCAYKGQQLRSAAANLGLLHWFISILWVRFGAGGTFARLLLLESRDRTDSWEPALPVAFGAVPQRWLFSRGSFLVAAPLLSCGFLWLQVRTKP